MPNLCVSATFNPPVITVLGSALQEETIHRIEQRLPSATTTTPTPSKEPPKFVFYSNPSHWKIELTQQYCDDLHRSIIYLTLLECLDSEGWKLRATNTVRSADGKKDVNKFFFHRSA